MAEANDTYKIIYQNLIDAGCDENIIEKDCLDHLIYSLKNKNKWRKQ